jgi:hypothetical protein
MMVQFGGIEQIEHAACRAGLKIGCPEYNSGDARVKHRADTHHTWLQSDKQFAID